MQLSRRPTFQQRPHSILLISAIMKNSFLYKQYCEEQNSYDQLLISVVKSQALQGAKSQANFSSQNILPSFKIKTNSTTFSRTIQYFFSSFFKNYHPITASKPEVSLIFILHLCFPSKWMSHWCKTLNPSTRDI